MKEGVIVIPETLGELVTLVGEKVVYHAALSAYLIKAKRRLASGAKARRKLLHVDLDSVTPEIRAGLIGLGLIQE